MKTSPLDPPLRFSHDDFAPENYDNYPSRFCTLQNENLFPRSRCVMFRDRNTPAANKGFEKIEPALLLASRMILYSPRAYAIFIRRRIVGSEDEWLDPESELKLPDDEVISSIKRAIPDLDFPPDLFKMAAFAVSKFHPARKSDVISIDYDMIRLLTKNGPSDSQRVAGLFFLAALIAHELAYILEFRYMRQGRVQPSESPFQTPPGLTCREAGTAWESRVFGGRVYPVCDPEDSLPDIHGISLVSSSGNFNHMKISPHWIHQLFSESHWTTVEHPLRPPIDKYAQFSLIEDDLIDDPSEISTLRKFRNSELELSSASPRKKNRRTARKHWRICGGKVVQGA